MASDVYIFGYQSMLAEGSLASSIGVRGAGEAFIPARLRGYGRDWSAVRDFSDNPRKRYVHAGDWAPAGRVAFANLCPDPVGTVNGVCHRVAADHLDELDFRELGYARVDVSGALKPYPGHVLMDLPSYAYIDHHPDPVPAPVSRAYYDMGRLGAEAIDARAPGFAADYRASTRPPSPLADDLAFVFFSGDGRHLWLLHEADSTLVLLLRCAQPQFAPSTDRVPEADRPVTAGLEWLDQRWRGAVRQSSSRIPAAMADEFVGFSDVARLAASPYWLCRLAATRSAAGPLLITLANDPDPWVRRAATLRRGIAP